MIVEWTVPFTLTTAAGAISLSGSTGYKFDQTRCDAGADLRVVRNNIPQEDGWILGHVFAEGYQMRLAIQPWETDTSPACDTNLRQMTDDLAIHLWALRDPGSGGRIEWIPSGAAARMLDQIKIIEREKVSIDATGIVTIEFTVATRYPYAMDTAEIVTNIAAGGSSILDNTGTAEFWPVFKVYGPFSQFTLTNGETGLSIVYNSGLPGASSVGGGDYIEIDTFRNVAYLNGDQANMKPGIDMEQSDFWSIWPGTNNIGISGASVDILWQAAWE